MWGLSYHNTLLTRVSPASRPLLKGQNAPVLGNKAGRTASVIEILVEDIDRLALDIRQMKALPSPSKRTIGFDL
jgi:hypothetical protein